VINVYLFIINLPIAMMMTVSGLFDKERNLAIVSALANIILSLALVKQLGVQGVLIGTSVSYVLQIGLRIWNFFHYYLKQSIGQYGLDMLQYTILAGLETWVAYEIIQRIYADGGILRFLLCGMLCVLIPVCINFMLYHRNWRYRSLAGYLKQLHTAKEKKGGGI
jgi:O-antigen/teichoic acid export membrane protein